MNKLIFISFFIFSACSSNAQKIVYDLPESVTKKISERISQPNEKYVILFSVSDSSRYSVTVMEDFAKTESFKILDEVLVQKTNRFIRVNNSLIPVITWEDIQFADFGTVNTPESKSEKRKVGKRRVHFTSDAPSIIFDRSGKIY